MTKSISLTALAALALAFATVTTAAELAVGDAFPQMTLQDQHEATATAPNGSRFIVIGFDMPVAKKLNKWLDRKGKNYLSEQKALWIADVTPMPKIIASTFAIPKMRKYSHVVYLVRDETFGDKFPQKKKHATVLQLDATGKVTAIHYAADGSALAAILGG